MASGMSLDDALKEMLGAETTQDGNYDTGDFSNMNESALYDLVFIEGEEELKETLKEKTLEEWRVFLHPYQNKLVQWDVNGPMSISGSAGTGKTVCLIHRAIRLAKELPRKTDKVLLTTYTTNLSIALKHQLASVDADAAERIDVTNLHALSRTICIRQGWKGHVATDNDLSEIWNRLKTVYKNWDELGFSPEEAQDEYEMVVDPNGIDSEEGYLTTVRSGRGRMSRNQRRKLWEVFKLFQQELNKRNLLTFEGVVHQARMAAENQDKHIYRHVLVDEIQDFGLKLCVL
jgi:superfamily I DNA/RNA helicase